MVDFRKNRNSGETLKKTNPIEIYDSLDRASDKGPLRPAQYSILDKWYTSHKNDRDIIIKLHTGQGKTLIGLLILQSRLNNGEGPAVFVCPNILLVEQTCEQARQFGIKFCKIENNLMPDAFLDGKAILITHVQKMFTGHSSFGVGKKFQDIGAIVLDDSHACIEAIQNSITIKIPREEEAYYEILHLFDNDLDEQGAAKLEEIKKSIYDSFLPVPYWAWNDKNKEIIKILIKYSEKKFIKFAWHLIKEDILACACMVSSSYIEITPYRVPIEQFGSFL